MKKYINLSLIYAVSGLLAGLFYREFTKWNGYTGVTTLGKVHTHLFMLGMFLFLLVALFAQNHDLEGQKSFRLFMKVHNIGLPLVAITLVAGASPRSLAPHYPRDSMPPSQEWPELATY